MRFYKAIFLLFLVLPSCVSENGPSLPFNKRFISPAKIVTKSYTNYLDAINNSGFPILSVQGKDTQDNITLLSQRFQMDRNLQYFPGTLWQVYSLDESMEWKNLAEKFSEIIGESRITYEPGNGELLQSAFLTPYRITGDRRFYSILIESLNQQISASESSARTDLVSEGEMELNVEKLLENELLYFATHETGDPIYQKLALDFTEKVYQVHFQNNISNEVFYGLANWNTLPRLSDLEKLNEGDFYCLSLCFYGFATLYKEMGYEKYGNTAIKLARLFSNMLEGDNLIVTDKMNLTSWALVSLALSRLAEVEDSDKTFAENSERIFKSMMSELDLKPSPDNQEYSFKLYYYLYEYIRENS